jgi:hypothetical protein
MRRRAWVSRERLAFWAAIQSQPLSVDFKCFSVEGRKQPFTTLSNLFRCSVHKLVR